VVFPGDYSKKKTAAPPPSSKPSSKPFTKAPENPKEAAPKPSPPVVKHTTPTEGNLTLFDPKVTRSSINGLISALDDVLGGHTVVFKFGISPSSNDYYGKMIKEKPYKAIEEIIRTEKFMEAMLGALRIKWKNEYEKSTDLRNKSLSIRVDKKLSKSEFVDKFISLLSWQGRKKQRTVNDASRLLYDLLEPIFLVNPEENKYITYLEEKLASEVGSQGNIKSGGTTLADFIVAPKKQNKKKKGKKIPEAQMEEKKEIPQGPVKSVASKEEKPVQDLDFDPIYNPETISKSIPFGWQFGQLTKSFLRKKGGEGHTNEQGGREWYFNAFNEEIDNAFVFWSNTDMVFLFTTGSE